MKIENLFSVCRICLASGNGEMKSVFSRDEKSMLISVKIEECGGIKITKDSSLPTKICEKCNEILAIAHKFRTICKNSDNYLQVFVRHSDKNFNPPASISDLEEYATENYDADEDDKSQEDYEVVEEFIDDYAEGYEDGNVVKVERKNVGKDKSNNDEKNLKIKEENQPYDSESEMIKDLLCCDLECDADLPDIDAATNTTNSAKKTSSCNIKNKKKTSKITASPGITEVTPSPIKRGPGRPRKNFHAAPLESSELKKKRLPATMKRILIAADGTAILRDISPKSRHNHVHICEICGNIYERKYSLEAHMRRHRGEKPFECEICKKSFALNFQLTRHMRSHTGQRPYKCKYCDRRFSDRSTNVKHERIHTNDRPYKCDTCGKAFTYSNVLKVHKMIHTGEKPYVCELCGKGFSQLHHLRAHLQTLLHKNDPRVGNLLLKTEAISKSEQTTQQSNSTKI